MSIASSFPEIFFAKTSGFPEIFLVEMSGFPEICLGACNDKSWGAALFDFFITAVVGMGLGCHCTACGPYIGVAVYESIPEVETIGVQWIRWTLMTEERPRKDMLRKD